MRVPCERNLCTVPDKTTHQQFRVTHKYTKLVRVPGISKLERRTKLEKPKGLECPGMLETFLRFGAGINDM